MSIVVKPGYKQTEVGVIPEDWEVKPLHALADKIMVGIASAATHAYRDRGIVMFRNQNIKPGFLDDSDLLHLAEDYELTFKNKRLKSGDLLTARTGYPGTTSIVPPQYEGAQSFTTLITRPCCNIVDSTYLCCFINSEAGQTYFEQNQIGGGQKNVNAGSLKYLPIPLPPTKAEQKAIAEALSDADALIESLEQLLAKKRQVKQGAMQELLRPKEGWLKERLGSLGVFLKGSGIRKDESQSGSIPCIRYGEIYTRHNDYIKDFYSRISREVASTAIRLKTGDVLFAGSGETKEDIGKCVAFVGDEEAFAGGDIVIFRPEKANSVFLGYYLNTAPINRQKSSKGQGDAVVHIGSSALSDIDVMIPPFGEQNAIATVLSDMDAEIETIETKLAKSRQIKQGMMQQLLTGKIRLVPPVSKIVPFQQMELLDLKKEKSHNKPFNDAVIISVLAKHFASEQYPLGRKRYTKFSYLLHRHIEHRAEGYLKKAAGPYNPQTRYGGAEKIAQDSGYIRQHRNGNLQGFVAGANVEKAEAYFQKWYGLNALQWLEQFRRRKNDELELLATVDMAMEDIRRDGQMIDLAHVKKIIRDNSEWAPKLQREIFSDANITRAIRTCSELFA